MDKKSVEEIEARFGELIQTPPYAVDEMLELISSVPETKGATMALALFKALMDAGDFLGEVKVVLACTQVLESQIQGVGVRDALRKCTKDRVFLSFVESVGFDKRALREAIGRLARLLSFHVGARVLSSAFGLGEVRAIDPFYRRVTVDFRMRRGHLFSYDAACETLVLAPDDHILVLQKADPERVAKLLKDEPGTFVKEMIRSFGDMPVLRLEDLCAQHGFVKSANWKSFWDRARVQLRTDKCVEIPTRRAEPIHVKESAETYGESWFTAFTQMKDPKCILSSVREFQGTGKMKTLTDGARAQIAERLAYALKGARGVDHALYARIAFALAELSLAPEEVSKARRYLWEKGLGDEERYLVAARTLPSRECSALVSFLVSESPDESKLKLFAAFNRMCFQLVGDTLKAFKKDEACEEVVATLLKKPDAPATLVTHILGRYKDFKAWQKLPPLVVILTHAIALGEGKQGGETLRMQNMIRRLFADQKWLEEIFSQLSPADQALFFERFQASIAWDPSTHHMIVVRMTKIVPELTLRQIKKVEVKKIERITSLRSYAQRRAAYEKLVGEEMPQNRRDIEEAREKGDLSENAEYQYAKDKERELIKKQSDLQLDLNEVKPVDFVGIVSSEVCPGTHVRVSTASGEMRQFIVLGEWDNDPEKGILSNKTRLAQNMMGKKAGDTFDLPDSEGNLSTATVQEVLPLSEDILQWIKATPA